MEALLSICIVVYKGYEDVISAVESIETHTDCSIPKLIYIVDNSPEDAEGKEQFVLDIEKYKDVMYQPTGQNLGFGKGHNYILERLNSKYHAIVNPDIILKDDAFLHIIEYMNANPDVGMCIPNIVDEEGNRQLVYRQELTVWDMFVRMFFKKICHRRYYKHTMQDQDYSKAFPVPFGQGSFLVVRSDVFKKVNGFDEDYFMYVEDADFCKRVRQISKFMYFPGATIIHKWEKGSHKNKKLFLYHLQSMLLYFKKWGWKWF